MNFAPNLPEQPTTSKFQETIKEHLRFFKGLLYLTKKLLML